MEYHLLDDKHIEVLAGDVTRGFWNYAGGNISRDGETSVKLEKNTKILNVRKKHQVSNLDTISELPAGCIASAALAAFLGPFGALAPHAVGLVGGKQEFVCVGCELKDGRKFIARMRATVFDSWNKFCEQKESKSGTAH